MSMLASVPAVRRFDTDRTDLYGFDVVGHMSSADVENLFGLLEAAYALHDRIDVLIRIKDSEGVDWEAVDTETMAEGARHAGEHVRRCALVGDHHGLAAAEGFFLAGAAGDCRQFDPENEDEAWAWIEGR
jgi:acetyl esterase/lipase